MEYFVIICKKLGEKRIRVSETSLVRLVARLRVSLQKATSKSMHIMLAIFIDSEVAFLQFQFSLIKCACVKHIKNWVFFAKVACYVRF